MYIYLKFRRSSKIPPCKQLVSNKQLPHVVKALESYAIIERQQKFIPKDQYDQE